MKASNHAGEAEQLRDWSNLVLGTSGDLYDLFFRGDVYAVEYNLCVWGFRLPPEFIFRAFVAHVKNCYPGVTVFAQALHRFEAEATCSISDYAMPVRTRVVWRVECMYFAIEMLDSNRYLYRAFYHNAQFTSERD
jgi:hypothetical protein